MIEIPSSTFFTESKAGQGLRDTGQDATWLKELLIPALLDPTQHDSSQGAKEGQQGQGGHGDEVAGLQWPGRGSSCSSCRQGAESGKEGRHGLLEASDEPHGDFTVQAQNGAMESGDKA